MPWAAVIGSPIDHSLSPILHEAAWRSLGLDSTWTYSRIEVDESSLAGFVGGLDAHCVGLSVTMPCKRAIIGLLDTVDPLAGAVGAVNTVIPGAGVLSGFNTDVHGIVTAIANARSARGLSEPHSALILGSGATASSSLAALATLGITRTTVAARRFAVVVSAAARLGTMIDQIMWSDQDTVVRAAGTADIVISTLPRGVADELADRLTVREDQTLLDVVYSPRLTGLVRAWSEGGGCVANGLDMLVYQAAQQVLLMTGRTPSVEAMSRAVEDLR